MDGPNDQQESKQKMINHIHRFFKVNVFILNVFIIDSLGWQVEKFIIIKKREYSRILENWFSTYITFESQKTSRIANPVDSLAIWI